MPVVINKDSGLAENLSDQAAQAALAQGTHEFPLTDPEGNPASAEYGAVPDLLKQGYTVPNSGDLKNALNISSHATPGQTAKGLAEAAASTATLGLSTAAERAVGVNPAEIRARREALETVHPVAKMGAEAAGIAGSALTGVGEGAALEELGSLVPQLGSGFVGKVGTAAARAGLENAGFQAGDEASKMFSQDPNQSAESAVANVGLSGLLGAGLGGALGTVPAGWDALMESGAGKELANFKSRIAERINDPNPVGTLTKELQDLHENVTSMNSEVYGRTGLKSQDIQKLMPEMSPKISEEPLKIQSKIQESVDKMRDQPFKYGGDRYPGLLDEALQEFKTSTQDVQHPGDLFNAMNELKQNINKYIPKYITPDNPSYDAAKEFMSLSKDLKNSLEDTSVWGKAGERQASINKAFSEFRTPLKDFEKKFTTALEGQPVVDPGKVNTYLSQIGKPNAEIKQEALSNFLDAAEKYRGEISKTHANLDIENPYQPTATHAAEASLGESTLGSKLADALINKGIGDIAGGAAGGALGALAGHPYLGAMFGKYAIGPVANKILPSLLKTSLDKPVSGAGMKAALQYGTNAVKGANKLSEAVKAVFLGGKIEATRLKPDERKRLKDKINEFAANPEAMMQQDRRVGHYLPEHETALASTAARAIQYLSTLRPDTAPKAPLDSEIKPNAVQEATYNHALDIAENPMLVLKEVKDGSLTPLSVQHLTALYPSLVQAIESKLTEQIVDLKSKDGMLPYKVKMSLSMLLKHPLETSLSQPAIAANQTPAPQQQPQPQMRPKHSMASISKLPQSYATPQQAREASRTRV